MRLEILVFNFKLIENMVEKKLNIQQNRMQIKNESICMLPSLIISFNSGIELEK